MKRTILSLAAALALIAGLAGCGTDKSGTKTTNTGYRTRTAAERDGQYYAANDGHYYADTDGLVYDAGEPGSTGLLGNFRDMADDAADGVRDAGNALGNTIDDIAR